MTDRAQTAQEGKVPIWRKTRAQKVDEKVESLFESYRMVDNALNAGGPMSAKNIGDRSNLIKSQGGQRSNKYF